MRYSLLYLYIAFIHILEAHSQITFSDDFENYIAGKYLVQQSTDWRTNDSIYTVLQDVLVDSFRAHSGKNSLFLSSRVNSYGPQDINLTFPFSFTNGLFHLEMWLFVEENTGAYWSIGESRNKLQVPIVQLFFRDSGTLQIATGLGEGINVVKSLYPQDEWFKMSLDLDINSKEWKFSLDDQLIGSFIHGFSSIDKLNFYPIVNLGEARFHIDDIYYKYFGIDKYQTDIGILNVKALKKGIANLKSTLDVTFENTGLDTIHRIVINVENELGDTNWIAFHGLELLPGGILSKQVPEAATLHGDVNSLKVTVMEINNKPDINNANNSLSVEITGVIPGRNKKVLFEHIASLWCGWSPRAYAYLDSLNVKYRDYSIGVQIHNQDGLSDRGYDSIFATYPYLPGIPWTLVDRKIYDDPARLEEAFLDQISENSPAILDVGARYNIQKNEYDIEVKVEYVEDMKYEKVVGVVIAEKRVDQLNLIEDQVNNYFNKQYGIMGGYENRPYRILSSDIPFNLLARKILDGFLGDPSVFSENNVIGDIRYKSFATSLDFVSDLDGVIIIALLANFNGEITSVRDFELGVALKKGLFTQSQSIEVYDNIVVFPNPSRDYFIVESLGDEIIKRIEILDITGRVHDSYCNRDLLRKITLALVPGYYILKMVLSDNEIYTRKLIVCNF